MSSTETRVINRVETSLRVVANPEDPSGLPLALFAVRVRELSSGRWWYVSAVHRRRGRDPGPRYTFTPDPDLAKLFTLRTARNHQANIGPYSLRLP